MARAKPTVKMEVSMDFPRFKRTLHGAAKAGVEAGSKAGAAAAAAGTPRGDGKRGNMAGHAADTWDVVQIQERKRGGYRGGFGSNDSTILWLALGTKGRRTRKLHSKKSAGARADDTRKILRETKEGRAYGMRPNPWVRKALINVALPVAMATIKRRAGRVG